MPPREQRQIRVAIDSGGTFTDCVWAERGKIQVLKVFSTPADPSAAIVAVLQRARVGRKVVLLHGTTVGTNTLLQRKGARVALVTTAGFEDVIEIGRQNRPKLYDLFFDRVEPLVPAGLRFGVRERIGSEGEILEPLSAGNLRSLVQRLRRKRPEAIAICLLFPFANAKHEKMVAAAVEGLAAPLSISHQILPEFREYERTSTVVINAYLQPVMQSYLQNLQRRTPGTRVFVMQSSGGITAGRSAAKEPVRTVLSGPAGGVVGALAMGRHSGIERIVSFDMALVDGAIRAHGQSEIAGLPIGVPVLDIQTVGAGGGSIARFDAGGALRVGPESAGADPGPICYGRGTRPTVADANLLLGRLRPDHFLGGDFALDCERARQVVGKFLREHKSRLSLEEFALGVVRVANATMEKAIRVVSIERGYDPREFTLVAFGGAGPLHACELAAAMNIPRVLIPALPGALSAYGILSSDVVKDYSRTVLWRVSSKVPQRQLSRQFAALRRAAESQFRSEGWRGRPRFYFSVDLRYAGQGYELNLPYTSLILDAFEREHRRLYGHSYPEREIEMVTLRLRAVLPTRQGDLSVPAPASRAGAAALQRAPVIFGGKPVSTAIYSRSMLQQGRRYAGPAVIVEYSATTLVPPGMQFRIDRAANLIIAVK